MASSCPRSHAHDLLISLKSSTGPSSPTLVSAPWVPDLYWVVAFSLQLLSLGPRSPLAGPM